MPFPFSVIKSDLSQLSTHYPPPAIDSVSQSNIDQSISRASYMCRKCKVHGKLVPVKRHKRTCLYLNCKCIKCLLVDQGRKVVARQIALYRDQKHVTTDDSRQNDINEPRSNLKEDRSTGSRSVSSIKISMLEKEASMNSLNTGPHCRRCRNHNVTVIWKNHKKACPYRHCPCDPCRLINVRKDTEKTLRDMQIVSDESNCQSRSKASYSTYTNYPGPAISTKSPSTSYSSMIDKPNFDFYSRPERSLSPSISAYYNASPGFLAPGMNSTFQRLVSATCPVSAAGDLSHLANISSPFSGSDLFCNSSDLGTSNSFKSLGGGFMNNRNQSTYQPLDYSSDMWTCLNPARSTAFSSYGVGHEYGNTTYSYLNSLGVTTNDATQTPLVPFVPVLDSSDQDNSSRPGIYRSFTDYCY